MNQGDVILTPVPQAMGTLRIVQPFFSEKCRLIEMCSCGVSTQLHQEVKGFDEVIRSTDSDFIATGLKTDSLIRLGFLAVLPRKSVIGSIGTISSVRHRRLLKRLSDYLIR